MLKNPVPVGEAQVPSPRQNVEDEAAVPEFRCDTPRFPVTPVVNGNPVQLVKTPSIGVPICIFGNVVLIDGTPEPSVTRTPLFAVANPDNVVPAAA
jgi:hypothetical protein